MGAGGPTCGRNLLVDSPPCPLPVGHWPERPHRAHSPYGDGRWVDYAEDECGDLIEAGRSDGPW